MMTGTAMMATATATATTTAKASAMAMKKATCEGKNYSDGNKNGDIGGESGSEDYSGGNSYNNGGSNSYNDGGGDG